MFLKTAKNKTKKNLPKLNDQLAYKILILVVLWTTSHKTHCLLNLNEKIDDEGSIEKSKIRDFQSIIVQHIIIHKHIVTC